MDFLLTKEVFNMKLMNFKKPGLMPANLENSAVATGLEKVRFHSNPKERQCQNVHTTAQLHSSHTLAK